MPGDLGHGVIQTLHGGVEVGLQARIAAGEVGRDAGAQVALRQSRQSRRRILNHPRLFGFGLCALLIRLQALGLGGFQIQRNDEVHVEHGGLHDAGQRPRQSLAVIALRKQRPRLGVGCDDRLDQPFQDQGVAADIPARLQADPGVGLADAAHALDIGRVKGARGEQAPVSRLGVLGPRDLAFRAEEAGHVRRRANLGVKGFKAGLKRSLDDGSGVGKPRPRGLVQLQEAKSLIQIHCVRHDGPLAWRSVGRGSI